MEYSSSIPLTFTLLFLLIFTVTYLLRGDRIHRQKLHDLPVPRIIWTYLPKESPTPRQSLCLETWRSLHPSSDWTIHILTPSTVNGYLHGLPDVQKDAPLLRDPDRWEEAIALHALTEHGGIWLHSHTYLRQPLDQSFITNKKEIFFFSYRDAIPRVRDAEQNAIILDKRAIASAKKNPFMENWKAEYMRILAFPSVEAYLASIPNTQHQMTASPSLLTEWVMTLSLHHSLLQYPYPMESIQQHAIEDGPILHLFSARGDTKKAEAIALDPTFTEPIVFL